MSDTYYAIWCVLSDGREGWHDTYHAKYPSRYSLRQWPARVYVGVSDEFIESLRVRKNVVSATVKRVRLEVCDE